MTAKKHSTAADWTDPDDAPDLSTPEYRAKFAATKVKRGRPKVVSPKTHISFRLAAEVVESIKATGEGYNARVEQALRAAFVAKAANLRSAKRASGVGNVVYIMPRPKGRHEGTPIEGYVIEDHNGHVLKTFMTQTEAIDWAKKEGHHPLVARVRHVTDKKNADHWRAA